MTQLTTKAGKPFTYAGWLRAYNRGNTADKMALGHEYAGFVNRMIRERDQRHPPKKYELFDTRAEEKQYRARLRKMPIAELRKHYYGTLSESMGGTFAPTAKRSLLLLEAEFKRRRASPKSPRKKGGTPRMA